jgi:hypothetical protein
MTSRLTAAVFGLGVLGYALPLPGTEGPPEKGPKQSFAETKTERVNFLPGGTIRLNHSYGYLTVEGWDEAAVEVTVTKSTDHFYEPERKEKAEQHFDQVRVVAARPSDKEFAVSTTLPVRNSLFSSVLPSGLIVVTRPLLPNNKRGVTVEYRVRVPRDSRLIVHHDNGYVWVSDVAGDIEVNSHTGDMIVMLTEPGPYSIDARTRVGSVTSDFTGKTRNQFLLGKHFAYPSQAPSRRVRLRMGRGSITIKKSAQVPGA